MRIAIVFTLLTTSLLSTCTVGSFLNLALPSQHSRINKLNLPAHQDVRIIENLPCNIPINDATMHLVHGRRCLLIPSRKIQNRNMNINIIKEERGVSTQTLPPPPPPIIVLGGMAQCIESWQHHLPDLSKERDVLMYEYCGSGLQGPSDHSGTNVGNYFLLFFSLRMTILS